MSSSNHDAQLLRDSNALREIVLNVSTLHRRLVMQDISHANLTTPQYVALLAISNVPEGCTMSELALTTHQVSATTTGVIDRLEARNLVERRVNPADRRSRRVFLTDDGKALLTKMGKQTESFLLGILREYTDEERAQFIKLLQRYVEASEKQLA